MNVISIDSIFVHALKHNKNYKAYNSIFYNIKHSLDTYIELIQAKIRVKTIEDSIENFFVRDIFNRKFLKHPLCWIFIKINNSLVT